MNGEIQLPTGKTWLRGLLNKLTNMFGNLDKYISRLDKYVHSAKTQRLMLKGVAGQRINGWRDSITLEDMACTVYSQTG